MPRPRYAVYFAPAPATPLWRAASRVIGRDAVDDLPLPFPDVAPCTDPDWEALTEEPRRYGFHATLKAPFELTAEADEAMLIAAAAAFATDRRVFTVPDLAVAVLDSFVALVPARTSADLDDLAADCVVAFEPFRAPLDPADRARRLAKPLPARQVEAIDRWGYPYVFEDFRFHMTLTGSLPEVRREPVRAGLAAFVEAMARPLAVDAIAIFRQDARSAPFRIVARLPFADAGAVR